MASRRDPRLLSSAIEMSTWDHDILTVLLEVVLAGSHEFDSSELVAVTSSVISQAPSPTQHTHEPRISR
jgi:hypothetical protein